MRFYVNLLAFAMMAAAPVASATAESAAATPLQAPVRGVKSAEHFARLPFLSSPRLSPDGTRIAARLSVEGVETLAIVPLQGSAEELALISLKDQDVNWFRWVNDEWLVAGVGATEIVRGQDIYIRRAVGVSADGKELKPLALRDSAQFADDLIWVARDGSPRILLGRQTSFYSDDPGFWPEVREVDVSTGKTRLVAGSREFVSSWYADANGVVRFGIGYNDRTRTRFLLYREKEGDNFRLTERAGRGDDLTVPALFTADPSKAIAISDSSGYDAVHELDLDTMTIGRPIFAKEGYDISSLVPDPSGTALRGVYYTDSTLRAHWFDPVLARIQQDLDKAVAGRAPAIVSLNRAQDRMIVHVGAADEPGSYYLYDTKAGVMQRIADVNKLLGPDRLAPVKTITYEARDGVEISAVLTTPKGRDAKDLPLILMPHGGPFARDSEEWDWWTQFLADRGYAVLQPNYRGSSGFGNEFAEKGQGEWGLKMQDDLNDAVAWAVESGLADGKRVCIVGASYGGYAAFRAAHRDPSLYRCAVSYAGVSDLESMLRYDRRFLNSGGRADWMKEQAPDLKTVSPIHYAADFGVPLLIMHGKQDKVVQVKQSREMAEKLEKAGKPFVYIEQDEGDHHFSREEDRLQFLRELEAFLAKHNPA